MCPWGSLAPQAPGQPVQNVGDVIQGPWGSVANTMQQGENLARPIVPPVTPGGVGVPAPGGLKEALAASSDIAARRDYRATRSPEDQTMGYLIEAMPHMLRANSPGFFKTDAGKYWSATQFQRWKNGLPVQFPTTLPPVTDK